VGKDQTPELSGFARIVHDRGDRTDVHPVEAHEEQGGDAGEDATGEGQQADPNVVRRDVRLERGGSVRAVVIGEPALGDQRRSFRVDGGVPGGVVEREPHAHPDGRHQERQRRRSGESTGLPDGGGENFGEETPDGHHRRGSLPVDHPASAGQDGGEFSGAGVVVVVGTSDREVSGDPLVQGDQLVQFVRGQHRDPEAGPSGQLVEALPGGLVRGDESVQVH